MTQQAVGHDAVEAKKRAYLDKTPEAIVDYFELVLSTSCYPDYFPQGFELDYEPSAETLIVDYQLPAPEDLPTLKAVRYVAARDAMEETHITDAQKLKGAFKTDGYVDARQFTASRIAGFIEERVRLLG